VADVWYPGADRSKPAWTDGGSILGGKPKLLWHDTETTGLPSYSSGSFPHFTVDPTSGHIWQHIPVNRAARALKNLDGGCQTNRWRVIQVEVIGYVNTVPYHPALGQLAAWAHTEHGVPATCGVKRLPYDASYGQTSVRLSCAEWDTYSGHLYHLSAPENDHGDPGDPFPMDQILAAAGGGEVGEDDLTEEQARQLKAIYDGMVVPGTTSVAEGYEKLFNRVKETNTALAASGTTGPEQTIEYLYGRVRALEKGMAALCDAQGLPFTPYTQAAE
jgi:hypothetical protein